MRELGRGSIGIYRSGWVRFGEKSCSSQCTCYELKASYLRPLGFNLSGEETGGVQVCVATTSRPLQGC